MSNLSEQSIMVSPGMFETRAVRGVKKHVPNRFDDETLPDETGTISLYGKSVGVQTAFWGGVPVWELVGSGPTWPHCETCSAPLDIGMESIWRCHVCGSHS